MYGRPVGGSGPSPQTSTVEMPDDSLRRCAADSRDGPRWVPSVASPVGRASEAAFPTRIRSGPCHEAVATVRSDGRAPAVRFRRHFRAATTRHGFCSLSPRLSGKDCSGEGAITGTAGADSKCIRRLSGYAWTATPSIRKRRSLPMNRRVGSGLASLSVVSLLFASTPAIAQISLGTAQNFGVLGSSTVTNTGATTVNGNVGVSPGSAVTGFPPGIVVGGAIHSNDAVAMQAQNDLTTAYNNIA